MPFRTKSSVGEYVTLINGVPHHAIARFNAIGGINHLTNFGRFLLDELPVLQELIRVGGLHDPVPRDSPQY